MTIENVGNTEPVDWNGRPYCAQLREELNAANARIQELTCILICRSFAEHPLLRKVPNDIRPTL